MTQTNSTSALAKGCGIALALFAIFLVLLGYAGWRLWQSAFFGDVTVRAGDKVIHHFPNGLANANFILTSDDTSSTGTATSMSKYADSGSSVSSECLSPITKVTVRGHDQWQTPSETQRVAILELIGGFSKDMQAKYQSHMFVNTEKRLVSSFDAETKSFCVAQFSKALPAQ